MKKLKARRGVRKAAWYIALAALCLLARRAPAVAQGSDLSGVSDAGTAPSASSHPAQETLSAQTFATIHSFDGTDGELPYAAMSQATDGNLYGTTYYGGASSSGNVFKITTAGTLTTPYSFCSESDCADGEYTYAAPVQGTDGNFYGTTYLGGANDQGTIFKLSPSGALTTLHSFDGTDGAEPLAGVVQAGNGAFYGATYLGGSKGDGTVFKVTSSGTFTMLHSFCSQTGCADGENPFAVLILGTDGNLYGTTLAGGSHGDGTVFKITPSGTLTVLHSFCSQSGCPDGEFPQTGMVQGTNGNFYGTTILGGAYGNGTIFKITPSGTLTTLYNVCSQSGCPDGNYLYAGLTQATDGNLYGIMQIGGAHGYGTIFKMTPSGMMTTLYSFCSQSGCSDGEYPAGGLVQDTNGNLYGTTADGGTAGDGTVFSLSVSLGPFVETQPASAKVGAAVNILGTNLTGATSVSFNSTAAVFKVVSSSEITTTVPAGATTGKVQVVTPSGTLSSNVNFRVAP
ncbi:MAG TPA: choice-of-anchor tandem repeat GloVer-containing protein [Terriglobia bacterium]